MLTSAGQELYEYAQRILDLHREARSQITGRKAPLKGELVVAASSVPGEYFLPSLLSVFGQEHPHIRVCATVTDSMTVLSQVERGEVGIGFVGRKIEAPHLDFRYLASDRMVAVVRPEHSLGKRKSVSFNQLRQHPLILRETGSGLRYCFEKSLERKAWSVAKLSVALELGSNEGIKEAVLGGAGVAILSAYAVQKELRSGTLSALCLSDLECDREMYIVRDNRRALPLAGRKFLVFLECHPVPSLAP